MVFWPLAEDDKRVPLDSRFGTGDVADIRRYIKHGPLGAAFAATERHVLLIDEVDKADLEFPNDLLRELDEMRFSIVETNEEVRAQHRPVVLITSGQIFLALDQHQIR